VVATDVGPSRELLGAAAGCLVPPRAEELALAVREVLASKTLAERMGAAGRARVEERFTLERQVASMERIYCEVAGGRDARARESMTETQTRVPDSA
jgi:glycosyltransferase involved in cell wall biosynthesis